MAPSPQDDSIVVLSSLCPVEMRAFGGPGAAEAVFDCRSIKAVDVGSAWVFGRNVASVPHAGPLVVVVVVVVIVVGTNRATTPQVGLSLATSTIAESGVESKVRRR